jgi:adenine-specific DNA-methyltransferase
MGGAFNVGANVCAIEKVVYNEFNPFVFDIMKMFSTNGPEVIIQEIKSIVKEFDLSKKNKMQYLLLRQNYNFVEKSPIKLFVLQIYAFQNMIRFNSKLKMNTPVGNNEFSIGIQERILDFRVRAPLSEYFLGSYRDFSLTGLPADAVLYFDPPYFITNAEYNDGKRGLEGWSAQKEIELLNYLCELDRKGFKFLLSNVLYHNGNTHHVLKEWVENHNFNIINIGDTGIKYPRKEVLITNYDAI